MSCADVSVSVVKDPQLHCHVRLLDPLLQLQSYSKEPTCRLPVVNFAAGGVATPADAALMMQMGIDGVFVGSGIFKSGDPAKRARAIVEVSVGFRVEGLGLESRVKVRTLS